jgi:Rieske Fe-S protein
MMLETVISRRSLLRGVLLSSLAGVAGYVVARNSVLGKPKALSTGANGYGPATSAGRYLVPVGEVPPKGGLILAADKVVLVREHNGVLKAFSAICTHQGCTVDSIANGVITCPCHGSEYSAVNGSVIRGPAPRPLPPIAIVVRDNDVYTV